MHGRKQTMEQENCLKWFVSILRAECINWREAQLASQTFLCNLHKMFPVMKCKLNGFSYGYAIWEICFTLCCTTTRVEAWPLLIKFVAVLTYLHNKKWVVATNFWPQSTLWLLRGLHVSDVSGYLIVQRRHAAMSHANRYRALPLRFWEEPGNEANTFVPLQNFCSKIW